MKNRKNRPVHRQGHEPGLWNHPALFDYQDRYMAVTAEEDMTPAWRYSTSPLVSESWAANPGWRSGEFQGNMWDEYRDDF